METIISHHSGLQFSLAPLVFLYFGSHFQIVVFLCRRPLLGYYALYGSRCKSSRDQEFDLSCRPLSAQRAVMANPRDARTNLMSRFVWNSVNCVRSTFDGYRYIIPGTTFISYDINSIV